MKNSCYFTLVVLTLAIRAEGAESDQPVPAPVRQELRKAEQASNQRLDAAEKTRREIQQLNQARDRWTRELAHAKTNLANAQIELAKAIVSSRSEEVERCNREVAGWEGRVKTANAEIKRLEEQVGAAERAAQPAQASELETDLLVAGDTLELVVMEDSSFNGIYPIRRGGYILIPRVGRVFVVGKDLEGAEAAIQETLQKNQILTSAKVVVDRALGNAAVANNVIFLAGEFEKPGPWPIPPGSVPTLLTTILQSGGVTENGDLSQVRLLRLVAGRQMVENFDVKGMLNGTNFSADIPIKANDIVVVPGRANEVYVTGNVKNPGTLKLVAGEELKAYSAILKSGGFSRFANEKNVYILRDTGQGAKERIPVNIKEIKKGLAADVKVQNRDIVVVPERFFSL